MDDSKIHENVLNHGVFKNRQEFHRSDSKFWAKRYLLAGADKVLLARNSLERPLIFYPDHDISKERKKKEKITEKTNYYEVSKAVNPPYNEFPLNIVASLLVLVLKFIGFQFSLLVGFFLFPIWLAYFSLMFCMFPFRTLTGIKEKLSKKIMRMAGGLQSSGVSQMRAKKSVLNVGVRFGWAFFWSSYVWFLLVGLFLSSFLIGNVTMRHLVEEPIQATKTLNFDYTKTSPVAHVPIMGSSGFGDSAIRAIPYDHKLQLIVSLTLPESEYNRKLGVFQVRVEFLSTKGEITFTSSYPTMLKFKSQLIRFVETLIKMPPLITGFQSETQTLNIKTIDFIEGINPTVGLRVILEQRAEYQTGAGIPEIYSALINLESQLPKLKRVVWNWRRTILVWISIISFLAELAVILVLCRPIVLPRGRLRVNDGKQGSHLNKISWY